MKPFWRDRLRLLLITVAAVIFAAKLFEKQYPAIAELVQIIGVPLLLATGVAVMIRRRNRNL